MENEKRKKKSKKVVKRKKVNTFNAQVNCTCKRDCATLIDIVTQKDIFDHFHGLGKWSEKTQYLRSIVKRNETKQNLNPRVDLKKKNYFSSFFLLDSDNKQQQVCSLFVTKLLQVNRFKVFRAVSSIETNPLAIDRRGKASTKKTAPENIEFAKNFIQSFPCYESKSKPNSLDIKYFHPRLNLNSIYQLYVNTCTFKQKKVLSKNVFKRVLHGHFSHLQVFKLTRSCSVCQNAQAHKKKKVLSPEQIDSNEEKQNEHLATVLGIKSELLRCIEESETGIEVLIIEMQRPLEVPLLSLDESFDIRNVWVSNLCIFDELKQNANMYVWDEIAAKRGPEEIASCLFEHIAAISKPIKKIIVYSSGSSSYRNTKMILFLVKILKERKDLQTIEQRFFFPGHETNDCTRCFDKIEKKIKTTERLFAPSEYISLISEVQRLKFTVVKMSNRDFFAIQFMPKSTESENQLDWTDVKSVIYDRGDPMKLRLNYFNRNSEEIYTFDEKSWKEFDDMDLIFSNKTGIAISKLKYDDLVLKTLKYIPSQHHDYYTSIPFTEAEKHDYVLAQNDE